MPRRYHWLALVVVSALAVRSSARADAVVTLCDADDQGGAGMNLSSALAAGGRITFQCGSGNRTIVVNQNYTIDQPVELAGDGHITLDIRNTAAFSASNAATRTRLRLSGLTLTNAQAPVSPLLRGGSLDPSIVSGYLDVEVVSCTIKDSRLPFGLVGGIQRVQETTFVHTDSPFNLQNGSGCKLTVTRSKFIENTASQGVLITACNTEIDRSEFDANSGTSSGGAIYFGSPYYGNKYLPSESEELRLTIRSTKFEGNTAQDAGGALAVQSGPTRKTVVLRFSGFSGNRAKTGGAISLGLQAQLPGDLGVQDIVVQSTKVSFSKNTVETFGGAIDSIGPAVLQFNRTVLVDNSAGVAGGAVRLSVEATKQRSAFANTLFARNSAPSGSGFLGSSASLINSTVIDHQGGAALKFVSSGTGSIDLTGSIIANNAGGNCDASIQGHGNVDLGHNLQFPDQSCGLSIVVADPQLDTLYLPLWGSPALAAGNPTTCFSAPVNGQDLFGQRRTPACAIGAVEGDLQRITHTDPQSIGPIPGLGGLGAAGGPGQTGGTSGAGGGTGTDCDRQAGCSCTVVGDSPQGALPHAASWSAALGVFFILLRRRALLYALRTAWGGALHCGQAESPLPRTGFSPIPAGTVRRRRAESREERSPTSNTAGERPRG